MFLSIPITNRYVDPLVPLSQSLAIPVVVVIKSGALTEIHSNGCMTVHPAGSAFFESPDEVHNVVNNTGVVTEVLATFLSPTGTQPLIPVPDPGHTCRH